MRRTVLALVVVLGAGMLAVALDQGHGMPSRGESTPAEMVKTYDSLATAILATKETESNMVYSILAVTYGHAHAAMMEIRGKIGAGEKCAKEIEQLADLISQLGNEGDASVAAIRKRLLEGGHHHHAGGEQKGVYDEGFVVVTRSAKKSFLDAAAAVGKMAGSPNLDSLNKQWQMVSDQYMQLVRMKG